VTPCKVCSRPDAGEIDEVLASGRSARSIALEVGLSEDAVQRHAKNHAGRHRASPVPDAIPMKSKETDGDPLDELVETLRPAALRGHNPALVHQYRLALAAQAAAVNLRVMTPQLTSDPEWIELRTRIVDALAPYPDARAAVVEAIR
jgi:hypothetical protein